MTSDYDGVGFRRAVHYPNDRVVTYSPDELNRVESITDGFVGTIRYDYMGPGRVLNRIYPNGTTLTMLSGATDDVGAGYDDARRIKNFVSKLQTSGDVRASFSYGYDNANNRLFERREHECATGTCPVGEVNRQGETYSYDAAYRLINRKEASLNPSGDVVTTGTTQDFTLDGVGNWKTHKKNAATYNQTINSFNQYTIFNGPLGQRTLVYDFLGNLTVESLSEGEQQFTYDFLNRLTGYLDLDYNQTTYRYDALGRRISKNLNGFTHTRFVYDGDRLIQERDGTSPGQVVLSYVYGLGADEILTRRRTSDNTNLFYHTNALGSVAAVTDSNGAIQERYKYDAYGQVTFLNANFTPSTSSVVSNNILFTGRYYDTESKLYYYRARMYHPYLGRFLQRDPLGEAASINLYNYVFNNPVNATDPTGMMTYAPGMFGSMMSQADAQMTGASTASRGPINMAGAGGPVAWDPLADETYTSLDLKDKARDAGGGGSSNPKATAGNLSDQRKLRASTTDKPLSSVSVLGKKVDIQYDKELSQDQAREASNGIESAVNLINENADKLSPDEKNAILQIGTINIVLPGDIIGATGLGTFSINLPYMRGVSDEYLASLIGHEGQHYLNAGFFVGPNLWRDEQTANIMMVGIGKRIGMSAGEMQDLRVNWICEANRATLQARMLNPYHY